MAHFSDTSIFKKLKSYSRPSPPLPQKIWRDPLYFIAFGLGSGTMPFAPGTFGTLLAIPFYLLMRPLPLVPYIIFVIAFIIFSSWISERVSREIHVHDHPGMCIDEFTGFFVTMINAPHGWEWILLGFLLFRLFDIWKPWPIRYVDKKIYGGFGMILDDIVAGIFAMLIIQIIRMLLIV
jgi:phosphatidylglycerophosphatase A